ncbi:hypothetical protein OAK38_09585, partial [Verrucomicrobia bacterium]|nr:hypothetical protein [Verrucomicrobiota bacterium]
MKPKILTLSLAIRNQTDSGDKPEMLIYFTLIAGIVGSYLAIRKLSRKYQLSGLTKFLLWVLFIPLLTGFGAFLSGLLMYFLT